VSSPFHDAYIVDRVVLRELEALVARAIGLGDGSLLRDFLQSRRDAYGRLHDIESTPLEPPALINALAQIGSIERYADNHPEARQLLQAARMTSTRPRDVAKGALASLVKRAQRLQRLVQLAAPAPILMREVAMVADALGALDSFDFSVRETRRSDEEPEADGSLVYECLREIHAADTESIGAALWCGRVFVEGPELFPRPTVLADLARWERFCGSLPRETPPRAATGQELVAVARRVATYRRDVEQDPDLTPKDRDRALTALDYYADGLTLAGQQGHAVIEWLLPDT
jgi:hypothetical protein